MKISDVVASQASRIAAAGVAVLLLSTWLIPGSPASENRATVNSLTVSPGTIARGALFRQLDGIAADNLGLKGVAVRAIGAASVKFGLSTSRQVVIGVNGETFYADDFTVPCWKDPRKLDFAGHIAAERDLLASRGAYFLYAIVPDKSSVEPKSLGGAAGNLMSCASESRRYYESLASDPASAVFGDWDALRARSESGTRMYLFNNTHWNGLAASIFATDLLNRLVTDGQAPAGTIKPNDIVPGQRVQIQGDLSALLGVQTSDWNIPYSAVRDGVSTKLLSSRPLADGANLDHWVSSTTAAPLIGGRTLIVRDSMFDFDAAVLAPYFADLTAVRLQSVSEVGGFDRFDRVIVQQVQRTVPEGLTDIVSASSR